MVNRALEAGFCAGPGPCTRSHAADPGSPTTAGATRTALPRAPSSPTKRATTTTRPPAVVSLRRGRREATPPPSPPPGPPFPAPSAAPRRRPGSVAAQRASVMKFRHARRVRGGRGSPPEEVTALAVRRVAPDLPGRRRRRPRRGTGRRRGHRDPKSDARRPRRGPTGSRCIRALILPPAVAAAPGPETSGCRREPVPQSTAPAVTISLRLPETLAGRARHDGAQGAGGHRAPHRLAGGLGAGRRLLPPPPPRAGSGFVRDLVRDT